MRNLMFAAFIALSVWTSVGQSAKIEYLEFADRLMIGSRRLVINGTGLMKSKQGKKELKDYAAALYLPSESSDGASLIQSSQPKLLDIVFMREMDREFMQESWAASFKKNCKTDCEAAKHQFKAFTDLLVDVQANNRLKMLFDRDGVTVEVKGSKTASAVLDGEAISRALLAMFIGDEPPSAELKLGLLKGETK